LVRFLACAVLAEYLNFWREKADGLAIRAAILAAAGLPSVTYWGLGLAGRLAASPFLKALDTAAIYGPAPAATEVELCRLSVRLRIVSDLPNWRARGEQKKENINV
jgi:hypothetical protein